VKILDIAAMLAVSTMAFGQSSKPAGDNSRVVLNTMAEELQRNFDALKKKADPPPYFPPTRSPIRIRTLSARVSGC